MLPKSLLLPATASESGNRIYRTNLSGTSGCCLVTRPLRTSCWRAGASVERRVPLDADGSRPSPVQSRLTDRQSRRCRAHRHNLRLWGKRDSSKLYRVSDIEYYIFYNDLANFMGHHPSALIGR